MKLLFVFILTFLTCVSFSQTISVLTSGNKISLRGLCVVNDKVLWASGNNGTVVRSIDGGKTFTWLTVAGYEQRDFRDVEAFDSNTAIIMAVAEPAIILKTKDGGKNWKKVFEDTTKGMFLDAMDFDGKFGVVVGDPINSEMFEAKTMDFGETWAILKQTHKMIADEAFFASSGTNVKEVHTRHQTPLTFYVSGGTQSRLFTFGDSVVLPLLNGKKTTGANSLACYTEKRCIVVGGDFANNTDTTGNCVIISIGADGNNPSLSLTKPQTPPHGYRSCVEFISEDKLITCGTSGVDISDDGGNNWTLISTESFHACQKAKNGTAVFLAGKDGRIARLKE